MIGLPLAAEKTRFEFSMVDCSAGTLICGPPLRTQSPTVGDINKPLVSTLSSDCPLPVDWLVRDIVLSAATWSIDVPSLVQPLGVGV